MTAEEAIAFVERHGVVLQSAKGPVPRLTEAILGEPVNGSWWSHARGHEIFAVLEAVADSPSVLTCRLVGDKVTLVHRRLWPALVRCAKRFPPARLTSIRQEHTPSGRHVNIETPFPKWVPDEIADQAKQLSEDDAWRTLGAWMDAS